jgi:hypothetical protein
MQRIGLRWLICFGALALLGIMVLVYWRERAGGDRAAIEAAQKHLEQQAVEKTGAPQYDPPPNLAPSPSPPRPAPPPQQTSAPQPSPVPMPAPPAPATTPGPSPADASAMPDFPWPPPKASAWAVVPNEFVLAGAATPTYQEVESRLGRALDAAGYYQRSLFAAPQGFAIVTQLERIDDSGTPANSSRWQMGEGSATFSLVAYLRRLLYAEPGRYRLVVLVVSDVPFSTSGGYLTASEASDLAGRGANALPKELARQAYSARHQCTALIYEFRKMPNREPEFVAPSPLPGRDHLVRANIWAALAGAQKN